MIIKFKFHNYGMHRDQKQRTRRISFLSSIAVLQSLQFLTEVFLSYPLTQQHSSIAHQS